MTGLSGYLFFLALLIAALITLVAGYWAGGLALLVIAAVVFARWPVDTSK